MADEDFDRALHRLRQELAARKDRPDQYEGLTAGQWDALAREGLRAKWAGDDEPEQVDVDMMANYNRAVIAEAANITRPGHIDWLAVGVWLLVGLTVLSYIGQGIRWAINR